MCPAIGIGAGRTVGLERASVAALGVIGGDARPRQNKVKVFVLTGETVGYGHASALQGLLHSASAGLVGAGLAYGGHHRLKVALSAKQASSL